MQLFELVSPRLFRPLAGPNRAFYAELLLLLWEECRHTADYSISRAEAVSRAEDYFAALAKPLALDADDAGDPGILRTSDGIAITAPDAVAHVQADQRVVDQLQTFVHRHADMVDELPRRRAGAAFRAIHRDEIRQQAGFLHRLGNAEPFPRVADGQLETGRFAAGHLAHPRDEPQQLDRRGEHRMPRR